MQTRHIFTILLSLAFGACTSQPIVAQPAPAPRSAVAGTCNTVADCASQAVAAAQAAQHAAEQATAQLRATMVGAVVAFNSKTCPNGWVEYAPAQGRFIRGIDKPGGTTDPDGQRVPGATQGDMVGAHTHNVPNMAQNSYPGGDKTPGSHLGGFINRDTSSAGGAETRPKNVALLYCVMQ